jgi:hypothetical protein
VQRFAPHLEVTRIAARADHAQVIQVDGRWGMAALGAMRGTQPTELAHAVRDFVALKSGNTGDTALLVTYQKIESLFGELPGMRTLHFGRVNGLDEYGQVTTMFVLGRPLPHDDAIWQIAQTLFSEAPIEPETASHVAGDALLRDGTGQAIAVRRFSDPRLEAVRWAISDAPVIQAVARGRPVNRTASNPLTAYVFSDTVLPLPVKPAPWVPPNAVERMLAAKSVAVLSATDAAVLFPELFSSRKCARCALDGVPAEWKPPNGVVKIRYQPAGKGRARHSAWPNFRTLELWSA